MGIIKKFNDLFKKKEIYKSDIDDINDYFSEFLDELFLNYDLSRDDIKYSIKSEKEQIKVNISIGSNIIINGRRGLSVVRNLFYKILSSKEMLNLRKSIKMNYELSDTYDIVNKPSPKQLLKSVQNDIELYMIADLGIIEFTIKPK